jgi:multiple sugar transport system substrate-binding protein
MPSWPGAIPDLAAVVAHDAGSNPSDKYSFLANISAWTTNVGHPGSTNAAISEIFQNGLISTMFAGAATGRLTPEEALDEADAEVRRIFRKWKENGKL